MITSLLQYINVFTIYTLMTYNILTVIARSNFLSTDKIKLGEIELKIMVSAFGMSYAGCFRVQK